MILEHIGLSQINGSLVVLEGVPGVGPATSRALLAHFKTVAAVREASEAQLAAAKGVSRRAARNVHRYFHGPAAPGADKG